MPILFSSLTEEDANLITLILSSSGLPYTVAASDDRWDIHVKTAHLEIARNKIDAYVTENETAPPAPASPPSTPTVTGLWVGAILLLVHTAITYHHAQDKIIHTYGANASMIIKGELYRATTALWLHSDAPHLMGNIAGIVVFGTAVCTITGTGIGWLMILLSGIIGNLLNAAFYQTSHLSIGASTAVFGAIGLLSGIRFLQKKNRTGLAVATSAWLPLAAGIGLLGILGAGGEKTDVTAHLFGMLAGVIMGIAHGVYVRQSFPKKFDRWCWVITVCLIARAWIK